MAEYTAQGLLLQSGDGASPEKFTTVATVRSVSGPSIEHEAVDVTGLEDTLAQYVARGYADLGEVGFEVVFDPGTSSIHDTLVDRGIAGTAHNYWVCWSNDIAGSKDTSAVDTGTEIITFGAAHGLHTGQPIQVASTVTMPAPLVVNTTYYVIYDGVTTIQVATTNANAVAGTAINLTGAGAGTISVKYGTKWMFSGILTGAEPSGGLGEALTGTLTLKATAAVTTAGA